MGLEQLAALLDEMGPPEGEAWFHQTESVVGFAPQKSSAMRPIILRRWQKGPTAVVFPRSTSELSAMELPNPAHTHQTEWPKCWLRDEGRIVLSRPVVLAKDALDEAHRICGENDPATIAAVKAARW